MRVSADEIIGRILLWSLILTTVVVTPEWSLDPINPIKMLTVSTFSFVGIGALLANRKALFLRNYRVPLATISFFILWLVIVFFVSSGIKFQQIYGTVGRNTGLVTYVALSILFAISLFVSNTNFLNKLFPMVLIVGCLSLFYGTLQAIGLDPFDWVNPYSPVFGFLGNPNFQSSLLGILGTVVFTQILSNVVKMKRKGAYLIYLIGTLFVIKETDSQQGYLVLLIGSSVSLGVFVNQRSKTMGNLYTALALIGFTGVLLGTLNKGPLASLLYKDSVTYRGDYWRAGWRMTLDNPVFGVGLDSYGDWYRRSRTIEATLRRGPDVTSNAAHNVFLDISAYGGFPLVLTYIALMVLVVVSAVKVIKRSQGFNAGFVGVVAGWVAFQAQSIISINQIGLALWGWVLSGLIIGFEINTRNGEVIEEKKLGKKATKTVQASAGTTVGVFVGLIVGVLAGMPPYLASAKYKSALETSNPTIIQAAAYIWPLDPTRMIQVAGTLNENKLEAQGLEVAIDATKSFPDNYGVWAILYSMKSASEEQKAEALAQMKRLDPLNPTLK